MAPNGEERRPAQAEFKGFSDCTGETVINFARPGLSRRIVSQEKSADMPG
jgi:hypothetical protein